MAVSFGRVLYYKTGEKVHFCTKSAHEMRCAPFFFCSWRGKRERARGAGRKGGADRFLIENPRRGRFSRTGGPKGREGVCGEFGNYGEEGGAKYFLSGPKMSTKFYSLDRSAANILAKHLSFCENIPALDSDAQDGIGHLGSSCTKRKVQQSVHLSASAINDIMITIIDS